MQSELVKQIFGRFRSLERYSHLIDYGKNELTLYFGLNCSGQFEYGIEYDARFPIGQFKLSQSVVKWILSLESKSANSLKKEIVNLNYVIEIDKNQYKKVLNTILKYYENLENYDKCMDIALIIKKL